MGQGLEPLTADLCLSSRSQPPQLPSRTDFFEQSKKKNVFRASTNHSNATTATTLKAAAAQLLLGRSGTPVKPLPPGSPARRWHQTACLTAASGTSPIVRHRRPPQARVTAAVTTKRRTSTTTKKPTGNCRRWPKQQCQQQGDTRSTLSSMLPDFPSTANTMEFG